MTIKAKILDELWAEFASGTNHQSKQVTPYTILPWPVYLDYYLKKRILSDLDLLDRLLHKSYEHFWVYHQPEHSTEGVGIHCEYHKKPVAKKAQEYSIIDLPFEGVITYSFEVGHQGLQHLIYPSDMLWYLKVMP